jgi:hypothetical protein
MSQRHGAFSQKILALLDIVNSDMAGAPAEKADEVERECRERLGLPHVF